MSNIESFKQGEDLTAAIGLGVKMDTGDMEVTKCGANAKCLGVVYKNPNNTDDGVAVQTAGIVVCLAGGAITNQAEVITDKDGAFVVSTPTNKDNIFGIS